MPEFKNHEGQYFFGMFPGSGVLSKECFDSSTIKVASRQRFPVQK